jgi:hypothetical protein
MTPAERALLLAVAKHLYEPLCEKGEAEGYNLYCLTSAVAAARGEKPSGDKCAVCGADPCECERTAHDKSCETCAKQKPFHLTPWQCTVCIGRGGYPDWQPKSDVCPTCEGGMIYLKRTTCPDCGGTGKKEKTDGTA